MVIDSQRQIFSILLQLTLLLCIAEATWQSRKSAELSPSLQRVQDQAARVYCWASEPCLYGFARTTPKFEYKLIPTWCKCHPTEICDFSNKDQPLRADIYRCFTAPTEENVSSQSTSASTEASSLYHSRNNETRRPAATTRDQHPNAEQNLAQYILRRLKR